MQPDRDFRRNDSDHNSSDGEEEDECRGSEDAVRDTDCAEFGVVELTIAGGVGVWRGAAAVATAATAAGIGIATGGGTVGITAVSIIVVVAVVAVVCVGVLCYGWGY